ncbi:sensor histidine kinase [Eubacteriales bacterium OttesenSCG-928-A19]|nr:sensor histidine kinase [Eubacteriales bacterium OttesenSCG-928-A19]
MKATIILWFSLLAGVLILALQAVSYTQLRQVVDEVGISSMQRYLAQTVSSLDVYLYDIDGMARGIMATESVQAALQRALDPAEIGTYKLFRDLQGVYERYTNTRTHVTRVILVNARGEMLDEYLFEESAATRAQPWYQRLYEDPRKAAYSQVHAQNYASGYSNRVFSLRRFIYALSADRTSIGSLIVDVNADILDRIFPDAPPFEDSCVYLLNPDGGLLHSLGDPALTAQASGMEHGGEGTRQAEIGGVQYVLLEQASEVTGHRLGMAIPYRALLADTYPNYLAMLAMGSVAALIIVASAFLIVRQAMRPMARVTRAMERAAGGDFSVKIEDSSQRETQTLVDGFNSMVERIRQLIDDVQREERQKKEIELYALRAQVSPHFLYNTLNSVRYLAKAGRTEDILSVTQSLISLCQASFERSRFISIGQELALVREYGSIQRLRYGMDWVIHDEVDAGLLDCAIPGFTIQPLVENALFHGIATREGGNIWIRSLREGAFLRLSVTDDGEGMDEATLRRVTEQSRGDLGEFSQRRGFTQIGLGNVHSRIRHFFGPDCGLTIESAPGHGTRVEICIPHVRLADVHIPEEE